MLLDEASNDWALSEDFLTGRAVVRCRVASGPLSAAAGPANALKLYYAVPTPFLIVDDIAGTRHYKSIYHDDVCLSPSRKGQDGAKAHSHCLGAL